MAVEIPGAAAMKRWWRSGRSLIARAAGDRGGNTAVVVSLSILPILLATGASLDAIRTYNMRSKIQADLDTALVAAVRDIGTEDTQAIQRKVQDWFSAQQLMREGSYALGNVSVSLVDDTITAKASGEVPTSLMALVNIESLPVSVSASVLGSDHPYMDVYFVIDTSPSMLLAATSAGQQTMRNSPLGCVFACHVAEGGGATPYTRAKAMGVKLRSDVSVDAVTKALTMIEEADPDRKRIRVALYTIGEKAARFLDPSFDIGVAKTMLRTNPALNGAQSKDENEYSDFKTSLMQLTDSVEPAGDGRSAQNPQKLVLMLTDGVQSKRGWVVDGVRWPGPYGGWDWFRVAPLNPAWCLPMKTRGVTVGTLYTEYLPIPDDWGYRATVGSSMGSAYWRATYGGIMRGGVSSSISRRDYIPYALTDCASSPDLFLSASSASEIENGLKGILRNYLSAIRLTQ